MVEETGQQLVSLSDYLQNVSLLTDADKGEKEEIERVSLMTVHAAKGLEFDVTFIVGAEKEYFPLYMNSVEPADVEEERRLFYVALTRAKTQAFISYADIRMKWGKTNPCTPSDFIKDIGMDYLEMPVEKRKPEEKSGFSAFTPKKTSERNVFSDFMPKKPERATPVSSPQNFKPIQSVSSKAMASEEIPDLKPGMLVEHDRFGPGVVLTVEGISPDIKAQIEFKHSGIKNLLLKFARIKIINNN
ncbi:MAG: hypothetical protein CVU05_15055 [Bacteroidetes bacterium HGW-Bacteroidetes-21]|nr:MAG: hypothetical protein CVU05_15055 [Bacteroidetes bacterium HGW-Bacteroidetes-21]